MSALDERRQRAREAFDDAWQPAGSSLGITWAERLHQAREDAIETATRVKLTPEIIDAAHGQLAHDGVSAIWRAELKQVIETALPLLGFEVEQ